MAMFDASVIILIIASSLKWASRVALASAFLISLKVVVTLTVTAVYSC